MSGSLFERVQSNKRKTWLVFFLFYLLFIGLGLLLGWYWGDYVLAIGVTIIAASLYAFFVWASAEELLLSSAHAKPATKKSHPVLYNVVESMSIAAGVPMPKIYVIEDSAMNAFATGRDPQHGVIVVTTGLLLQLNRRELEGVIAHEMAHIRNYDIRVMLFAAVMVGAVMLLSDFLLRSFLWGGKGDDREGGAASLVLIVVGLVLALLAPIIAQLIHLAISRRREYLADADAVVLTRYPKGLAGALRKIAADPDPLVDTANKASAHLYINVPFRREKDRGLWHKLFSTHPPIEERITILERM